MALTEAEIAAMDKEIEQIRARTAELTESPERIEMATLEEGILAENTTTQEMEALEKRLNELQTEINDVSEEADQAKLDHNTSVSPENAQISTETPPPPEGETTQPASHPHAFPATTNIEQWLTNNAERITQIPDAQEFFNLLKNDAELSATIIKTIDDPAIHVTSPDTTNTMINTTYLDAMLAAAENNPNGFKDFIKAYNDHPEVVTDIIKGALKTGDIDTLASLVNENAQQPQPTTQQPERSVEDLLEATRNQSFSTQQSPIQQQSPIHDENTRTALVNDAKTVETFNDRTLAMQKALVEKGYSVGEYKNNGSGHKAGDPLLDGREGPLTEAAALKAAKDLGISEDELKNMPIEEFIQKVQDGPDPAQTNTPAATTPQSVEITVEITNPAQEPEILPEIQAWGENLSESYEIQEEYAQPIGLNSEESWDSAAQHFTAAQAIKPGELSISFQSANQKMEHTIENEFDRHVQPEFKSDIAIT